MLKYIEDIDLSMSEKGYTHTNKIRPSWAKIGTFIECESWNSDIEDDLEQPSLEDLKVQGRVYEGTFSYPTSEKLGKKFWVVYKPDFSIFTWFNNKPEDLSLSGIVLVSLAEIIETTETFSTKYSYIRFSVDRSIKFAEISNHIKPSSSNHPLAFFQGLIDKGSDPFWIYDRINHENLIMISVSCQADVGAWCICQQQNEDEPPIVIIYHENWISSLSTFFGHCQLTHEIWEKIDSFCR